MAGAGTYKIVVAGAFDPEWSSQIGGMNISERLAEDGVVETVLIGRLKDQAELSGILNTLYELHFPIACTTFLGSD